MGTNKHMREKNNAGGLRNNISFNNSVQANTDFLNELKDKLPEFFTADRYDESGELVEAGFFDWVKFKNQFDENGIQAELTSGYQLDFIGKNYARQQAGERPTTVIIPDKEHNGKLENANSKNLFFTGDNLEVLRHLQANYQDSIDFIYIDPPYNTGTDGFVYPDTFDYTDDQLKDMFGIDDDEVKRLKSIQGKATHSAWLTFMYPRLYLAKKLLKHTGVVFVSIDDNEQANLKILMDEIFGEGSFIADIHVEMSLVQGMKVASAQNGKLVKNGEYILVYSLANDFKNEEILYDGVDGFDTHFSTVLIPSREDEFKVQSLGDYILTDELIISHLSSYNLKPSFKNFVRLIDISADFKELIYSRYADKIYQVMAASIKIPNEVLERLTNQSIAIKYKKYILYRTETGTVRQFSPLSATLGMSDDLNPVYGRRRIRGDWWRGFYQDMMNVAKEGGGIEFKNGKKPVRLIKQLIKMATNKNAIVFDFFAGSSTTADAVMQLNAEDGGNRQFIMATLPEPTYTTNSDGMELPTKGGETAFKAGFKSIDELSRERIKRAAHKIKEENPFLTGSQDFGFKHYRMVSPSIETLDKLEYSEDLQLDLFDDMLTPFSSQALGVGGAATGFDTILSTWLVADGYRFDSDVSSVKFGNYEAPYVENTRVYIINNGWGAENTKALVNAIGTNQLVVQTIVVYGYEIDMESLRELEQALSVLENRVNLIVRY